MSDLCSAAYTGDVEKIQAFLKARADVNAESEFGSTPLHTAAVGGELAALEALIAGGADLNALDSEFWKTALELAQDVGEDECVEALQKAADARAKNPDGMHAASEGKQWTVTLDKSNGKKLGIRPKKHNECILVETIIPGLVMDWNQKHLAAAVQEEDLIRSVNGVGTYSGMLEELKSAKVLEMVIWRSHEAPPEEAQEDQDRSSGGGLVMWLPCCVSRTAA